MEPTRAPPAPPVAPVTLDATALARLRELDPDGRHGVLLRLLGTFETTLSRMLAQLAAELEGGDASVVMSVAHTLRSSSAAMGALDLARACTAVEHRLRSAPAVGSEELQADIELLLRHGEAALNAVGPMLRP